VVHLFWGGVAPPKHPSCLRKTKPTEWFAVPKTQNGVAQLSIHAYKVERIICRFGNKWRSCFFFSATSWQ